MINHPNRNRKTATVGTVRTRRQPKYPQHDHDADWAALIASTKRALKACGNAMLFQTDVQNLWVDFITKLPDERQVHECHACRHFVNRFGGLVMICDDGSTVSAFWNDDDVPDFYAATIRAMQRRVVKARVTSPFLSSERQWGTPLTGMWTHFGVKEAPYIHNNRGILTAGQAMAAHRENHHMVARALDEFTAQVIGEAERLIQAEHLPRPEKFLAPVQWLADLHARRGEAKDARHRDNILWKSVAAAPEGFCHPKASVIGPLLDDIAAGLPFNDIKAKFTAMVNPLRYQRPQAEPKAQNIAQAEKVVAQLGIERSLARRFAVLDEVECVWLPVGSKKQPVKGGVFGHLNPRSQSKNVRVSDSPAAVMTWDKFTRTILPSAEQIECKIGLSNMNFIALTSAVHQDAPPVLKWDREDARNPVAWYVYPNGSPPRQWGLSPGWKKVTGITQLPPMWGDNPQPHLGEGFVLLVEDCVDTRSGQGNALFPECLRGELHAIRATIEAYSRREEMHGRDQGSACGLDVRKGAKNIGYYLRVTSSGVATEYQIDRWD